MGELNGQCSMRCSMRFLGGINLRDYEQGGPADGIAPCRASEMNSCRTDHLWFSPGKAAVADLRSPPLRWPDQHKASVLMQRLSQPT